MLTAELSNVDRDEIATLGVSDYLVKPFTMPQLVEKIGKIVALRPHPKA
jgi:DNA-binding response OmpR family regulator